MTRTMLSTLVLTLLPFHGVTSARAADGFRPLLSGDEVSQFTLVKIDDKSISIHDGEVRLTGKPNGYFATKESFKNYTLRFDWKYDRPESLKSDADFQGNSGLLVHIEDHKVWPKSVEIQLANSDAGNIFGVDGAPFQGTKNTARQHKAIKPVGEWNSMEVTCKDGSIECSLNGAPVASGLGDRNKGALGWQSEGSPIRFRKIEIKTLD